LVEPINLLMSALAKYWFLGGFDFFKKLGMPTMMRMCEILEMENINKGMPIEISKRGKESSGQAHEALKSQIPSTKFQFVQKRICENAVGMAGGSVPEHHGK